MLVLPPGLDQLHSNTFGTFTIEIGRLQLNTGIQVQPIFRLRFLGQRHNQHVKCKQLSNVEYKVHCTLWHLYQYLTDTQTLKIDVLTSNSNEPVLIGEVSVFLPLLLPRTINENLDNLIELSSDHQQYGVFRTEDTPPFTCREIGKLRIRLHTNFNQRINDTVRPLIGSLFDQFSKNNKHHETIHEQRAIESDSVLDMMLLNKQFNPVAPTPISPVKGNNMPSMQSLSLQEHTKLMEQDIDRMVAELESREYDSSKYQDASEETGYKTVLKANTSNTFNVKSSLMPYVEVSEYNLKDPSQTLVTTGGVSGVHKGAPFLYTKPSQPISTHQAKSYMQNSSRHQQSAISYKTLKIDLFQLNFSGMPFNEQQLMTLCTAKLRMILPNQQQATFIGRRSGQTVAYDFKGYEAEVNERTDSTGQTKLFVDSDTIIFNLIEQYSGKELAYGTLDLQRLIRAEGKGVFVVSLNNRNLKSDNPTKGSLTLSPFEMAKLKPATISLYSLRVGLELLSHVKGKVYQLLLQIDKISELSIKEQQCQIRYKLYGTQQNVEVECLIRRPLDHRMVMPVLLESLINQKSPKILVEVWTKSFDSLIGLVELDLTQIGRALLHQNGRMDESILTANLYPIFLYKGSQQVKNLITKRSQGNMDICLAFGNVKQINKAMTQSQKAPVLIPNIMKQEKKMTLPYDEKLGMFVKQKKKELRQMDVQVDIRPEQQVSKIKEEQPEQSVNDEQQQQQKQIHFIDIESEPFNISEIEQPKQIQLQPQQIASRLPPLNNLTKQFVQSVEQLIQHTLSISPNFMDQLKQSTSKYLLFSFIERPILLECMVNGTGIDEDTANQLIALIPPTVDSSMLSVTPLYDYLTSYTINHTISEKLISDNTLGEFMLERYAELIDPGNGLEHYISEEDDIKQKLKSVGYHVSLREKEIFWKRYSSLKIKNQDQWKNAMMRLKTVVEQKRLRYVQIIKHNHKILEEIYPICNDSQLSDIKHNCLNVSLRGMQSCIESAKCLLNLSSVNNQIRITLLSRPYQLIYIEDTSQQIVLDQQFKREQFSQETAKIQLLSGGNLVSQCSINLQRLVLQDIDGTYAMKTLQGEFCGLVRLTIQFVE